MATESPASLASIFVRASSPEASPSRPSATAALARTYASGSASSSLSGSTAAAPCTRPSVSAAAARTGGAGSDSRGAIAVGGNIGDAGESLERHELLARRRRAEIVDQPGHRGLVAELGADAIELRPGVGALVEHAARGVGIGRGEIRQRLDGESEIVATRDRSQDPRGNRLEKEHVLVTGPSQPLLIEIERGDRFARAAVAATPTAIAEWSEGLARSSAAAICSARA